MHNLETLQTETIDGLDWDDLWVGMDKESLYLDPLLLLFCEVVSALTHLDFSYEFINDNRDEKIHDEERGQENVDDED